MRTALPVAIRPPAQHDAKRRFGPALLIATGLFGAVLAGVFGKVIAEHLRSDHARRQRNDIQTALMKTADRLGRSLTEAANENLRLYAVVGSEMTLTYRYRFRETRDQLDELALVSQTKTLILNAICSGEMRRMLEHGVR